MSLAGGPAAGEGVGDGDGVWAVAATQLDRTKQAKTAMLAVLLLMVGILGLSYSTALTLYQG